MIVYQDILTGDEILSDEFPKEEVFNGLMYKVQVRMSVLVPDEEVGADPGDKGWEDSGNIVNRFGLQTFSFKNGKSDFVPYLKDRLRRVTANGMYSSDEQWSTLDSNFRIATKFFSDSFENLEFFVGESDNDTSAVIIAIWEKEKAQDAQYTYFYYFVHDLKEIETSGNRT